MLAINSSGFCLDGTTNVASEAAQVVTLWVTSVAVDLKVGDWIAEFATDTTNPAGATGDSYRNAISTNADALMGTVGVLVGSGPVGTVVRAANGAAGVLPVQIRGRAPIANVDSAAAVAIGDDLVIGTVTGRAIEWTDGPYNVRILGRCASTPSSNGASVYLYEHPKFAA